MGRDNWDQWTPGSGKLSDRNAPITQTEIEDKIATLVEQLFDETEAFETLSVDSAKKESAYKKAWFTDYLAATGPVKERESLAGYKNADLYMEAQIAEALMKSKRGRIDAIRTALDALRTLSANVRAQT